MVFCVMIDRNGYLPVHGKIYSHPQLPGDVAFNTQTAATAASSTRSRRPCRRPQPAFYLIQSYARHLGNGKTVMMREIDVPIRLSRPALGQLPDRIQALSQPRANVATTT